MNSCPPSFDGLERARCIRVLLDGFTLVSASGSERGQGGSDSRSQPRDPGSKPGWPTIFERFFHHLTLGVLLIDVAGSKDMCR